jgi:hypothetical protein
MSAVTAFLNGAIVAEAAREQVARLLADRFAADLAAIRIFENEGGRITDLEIPPRARLGEGDHAQHGGGANPPHSSPERGGGTRVARWRGPGEGDQPKAGGGAAPTSEARPRGRPKLGVVPREITLLPRHWDWLAVQPGGASAALRRLVEAARKAPASPAAARDAACRFMGQMCGDRPGYEEAVRALYRGEDERFEALIAGWPADVRAYIAKLLEA